MWLRFQYNTIGLNFTEYPNTKYFECIPILDHIIFMHKNNSKHQNIYLLNYLEYIIIIKHSSLPSITYFIHFL